MEFAHSEVFAEQHRQSLKELPVLLEDYQNENAVTMAAEMDAIASVEFFPEQSEDALEFFKSYAFNQMPLRHLTKRESYLMLLVKGKGRIVVIS